MRKIVKGKMYDTDKAREVGMNCNNETGFGHWCETLYQKRTGEFFLHGEGGPMTKYARRIEQNSWSGGEQIIPMSYKTAQEWAEENLEAGEYENIFGEVSEGEDDTIVCKLSAADSAKLRRMAQERGISVTAMVAMLIRNANLS